MKLYPKCLGQGSDIGSIVNYSSLGYFVPCCWMQDRESTAYLDMIGFFELDLHIDNNDDILKIFNSEPWKKFQDIIENNPSLAPRMCHKQCNMKMDDPNRVHNYETWNTFPTT